MSQNLRKVLIYRGVWHSRQSIPAKINISARFLGPFFQKDKNSISAKKAYPPAFFHNKHLNIDLVWASNELKLTKVTGSGFENSFYQLEPSPIEKQLFKNLLV